jgi:Flp pilus assembly protein TadG
MLARSPRPAQLPTRRRGATLVEAAFVIVVALMFLYGIIEYARYLMVLHIANNAAREGARYAVVHTGDGTTQAQVVGVVTDKMSGVDAQIQGYNVTVFTVDPAGIYNTTTNTYNYPPTLRQLAGSNWNDAQFGGGIAVQITGTYNPILPTFLLTSANLPVTVTAVMSSEAN